MIPTSWRRKRIEVVEEYKIYRVSRCPRYHLGLGHPHPPHPETPDPPDSPDSPDHDPPDSPDLPLDPKVCQHSVALLRPKTKDEPCSWILKSTHKIKNNTKAFVFIIFSLH